MGLWCPAKKPNPDDGKPGLIRVTDAEGNLLRTVVPDLNTDFAPCARHHTRGCDRCTFSVDPKQPRKNT